MNHPTQPFVVPRFQDRVGAESGPSEAFSFCGLQEQTVDAMPPFFTKRQTDAKGRLLSGLSCWLFRQQLFLLHAYAILPQIRQRV